MATIGCGVSHTNTKKDKNKMTKPQKNTFFKKYAQIMQGPYKSRKKAFAHMSHF
jgi:hypothetical protein